MTETLAGGVPSGGSSASLPAINVRASDAGLATELRHPFVAAARRFIALDNALLGQERVEVVASSVCSPALWSPAPARPAWYFSNSISKERASAAKDASPAKDSAVLSAADIEARFAASTPFDEGSIVAEIRRRRSKFIGRCQREHLLPQKEHLLPNGRPPTVTTPAAAPATEKTRPAAVPAAAQSSGGRPATEKTAVPAALQRPAAETIRPAAEPTVQISGVAAAVQSGRPAEKQHDAADAGPAVALLVDSEHGAIPRPAKAPPPSAVRVAAEAPAAASPAAVDSYEDAFDDDASAAPALSKAPPAAPPARDDAVEAASAAVEAAPTADVSPTAEVKPTADAAPAASPRAAADDDYADDYDAEETAATPQKEASAAETSAAGAAAGAAAGDAPPAAVAQTDRRSVASEDDYAAARDDYDAADDDYADDADADDDDALGADTLCASGDDGGYRDDF
ncbi:hypothetical protein M885DRAFT_210364 [Pelagophyceae sp. CCMP2097]|nr:hypothetical protein M885DRAFT_210364 [Pelagophyceae sp. CCMP2097]